jgi:hypothetical protein
LAKATAFAGSEPHTDSTIFTLAHRIEALARGAFLSIAPSASVGALFIALLSILLAGVLLRLRNLFAQDPRRFMSLTVLVVAAMVLSLVVPDRVGVGSGIVDRLLLYAAIFLVLLALASGVFNAQLLTLCSFFAALSVLGFAGEYLLASKRLAPGVAEAQLAMESIPRHSRVLLMGYRLSPESCSTLPLLQMTVPERHSALAAALKNELIVLNDYQASSSVFPLKYLTSRYAGVINEVDSASEQNRADWLQVLKSDPAADFVLSWGTSRGPNCPNSEPPPFEQALRNKYDVIFFQHRTSRVELWRRRASTPLAIGKRIAPFLPK